MVHARRLGPPSGYKYFPATITQDDQLLRPGENIVVTIAVTDHEARPTWPPGQPFTIRGDTTGHDIISRRVLTDSGPC